MPHDNKEVARVRSKLWRAAHLEDAREKDRAYAAGHREEARARSKAWYYEHVERARAQRRERNLVVKFGITQADYDAMFARQGGVCLICGHPPKAMRLAVDHCHKTGRIRGLLCFRCNRRLMATIDHDRHLIERALLYADGLLTEPPLDGPMTAPAKR